MVRLALLVLREMRPYQQGSRLYTATLIALAVLKLEATLPGELADVTCWSDQGN